MPKFNKFFFRSYFLFLSSIFLSLLFFVPILLAEEIEGVLSVQILDFPDGTFDKSYSLQTADEKIIRLDFSSLDKEVQDNLPSAGTYLQLKGEKVKKVFFVEELPENFEQFSPRAFQIPAGSFRVVTILVNISGVGAACSKPDVDFWMYNGPRSTRSHLEASSRGQNSLISDADGNGQSDIFGPYNISAPASICDPLDWAQKAEAAATAAGVNLSQYDIRIFVLPHYNSLNCGWSGYGTIDCLGDPSYICRAWISFCSDSRTYIHELGHAYGMQHASIDLDNNGIVTGSDEYSDHSCPMGNGPKLNLFNAPHQDQMNWFALFPGSVVTSSSAGNFTLSPFENDPSSSIFPHVVKIPRPGGGFYYLSYRSEIGIWGDFLSLYSPKLNIHTYIGAGSFNTMFVDSLDASETFVDPVTNLQITVNSITNSRLDFSINNSSQGNQDSDGDGVNDNQEIIDGTDPTDVGSFLPKLSSPVHTLWNGFLDMVNIIEIINPSATTNLPVNVEIYRQDGTLGHSQFLNVGPSGQSDLILNSLPGFSRDAYGVVKINYSGNIDGRMSYYRSSGASSFEFAYSIPFDQVSKGDTAVGFNTFQPSQNPFEAGNLVYNWLTVVNLSSTSQNFQVQSFDQSGALIGTRNLTLPTFGRADIDGGHQVAGPSRVGFHRIIPSSSSAEYISQLMRYGSNAPAGGIATAFDFAFPLIAKVPNGEVQVVPVSNSFSEENWIELINAKTTTTSARVEIFNSVGTKVFDQTVFLAPFAQINISTLGLLSAGDTGFALITPSQRNSIVAQTMFYFRNSASGSVSAIYGSQAREALGFNMFGSYNLFLGMENYLRISNTSANTVAVNIQVITAAGPVGQSWSFPPRSSIDLPIHSAFSTSPDTYGFIEISSSSAASIYSELIRKKDSASDTDFVFSTLLRP